jgi:hypothetical protein
VAAKGKVWSSQAQTCVHNSKSKHQAQQQLFDLLMTRAEAKAKQGQRKYIE